MQAREERISRNPYLRVDIGFAEDDGRAPGFSPPPTEHAFNAGDFGLGDDVAPLAAIAPEPGEDAFTLTLWVTNQQSAPLGTAYRIQVFLVIAWPAAESWAREELTCPLLVEFTYIEPHTTTAIRLGSIRRSLPYLVTGVVGVEYQDIFGGDLLVDHHGAVAMVYDGRTGSILNERRYQLGQ